MLFMDLTVNNQVLYSGQAALGQVLLQDKAYLGFSGGLMFVDTQGFQDPAWATLDSRFILVYFSSGPALRIQLQATPIQNLTVSLGGQVCVIGLYEQPFPSGLPYDAEPPFGADEGYTNQAFLAGSSAVYANLWATSYYRVV